MSEIVDYDVVIAGDADYLILQVRGFIKKGWEPIGGVQYDSNEKGALYLQAIMKREPIAMTPSPLVQEFIKSKMKETTR
jgi:hypothetical protein